MLRRFADARLARQLADATDLVRRLNALLRQKTAEAATNYALAQRWKSIAAGAQADLAAERARTQEPDRLSMVAPNGCDDCSVEPFEHHRYPNCPGNERARTQETQP